MKYKAVIWDMDGVLVDTGDMHFLSWCEVARTFGYSYSRQEFDTDFGRQNKDILERMLGSDLEQDFIEEFCQKKEDLFLEMAHNRLQPIPGLLPVLQFLQGKGIPMAVASSSPMQNIKVLLKELQIRPFFDVVLSVGSLPGKPDPAVFLEAARSLDVLPAHCVVFEDSIAGVAASKAGGMTCVAITTTNPPELLAKADTIIGRYEELPQEFFS